MRKLDTWLETNGLRFSALESAGDGEPALFLHATSFCSDTWQPVWRAARAAGWDGFAVAVDQRGHGRSSAPPECSDYHWTHLAHDALAFLDALPGAEDDSPVALIGHSSGATALLAAAGMRPARVSALVLIEPVLFVAEDGGSGDSFAGSTAFAAAARRRKGRFASRGDAADRLRGRFPYSGFDPASFDAYLDGGLHRVSEREVELCCTPEREAWMYEGAAALDVWRWTERVSAPLLLVLGEHSAVPAPLRQRLIEQFASARVDEVRGATHFAALERPDEVGAIVARFLEGLPR